MSNIQNTREPILRFPEFNGMWSETKFSSFLDPELRAVPKPEGKYLALGIRSHGRGVFQKPNSDPKKIAMDTLYTVRENDLVVNSTFAWEGAIAIAKHEDDGGLVSHRFPTYVFNRDHAIHEFFEYIIENRRFRHKLDLISPGGAGRNRVLSKPAFLKLEHPIPSVSEQSKIAAFLGAVDGKIGELEGKRSLLEKYKRGCMHQLFSQRLRFKDASGSEYPSWEETSIGDVGHFYYGKSAPKFSLSPDAPTPCVRYGELYSTYDIIIDEVMSKTNIDPSQLKFSKGGEILVPRVGENPLDFATCCYLPHEGIAIGEMISVFNTEENPIFYTYYFRNLQREFARVVEGGNVSNLYYSYLEPIRIGKPHPEEQKKIADFLTAIDAKIRLVSKELKHAQTFKKGLLQQMFL